MVRARQAMGDRSRTASGSGRRLKFPDDDLMIHAMALRPTFRTLLRGA